MRSGARSRTDGWIADADGRPAPSSLETTDRGQNPLTHGRGERDPQLLDGGEDPVNSTGAEPGGQRHELAVPGELREGRSVCPVRVRSRLCGASGFEVEETKGVRGGGVGGKGGAPAHIRVAPFGRLHASNGSKWTGLDFFCRAETAVLTARNYSVKLGLFLPLPLSPYLCLHRSCPQVAARSPRRTRPPRRSWASTPCGRPWMALCYRCKRPA